MPTIDEARVIWLTTFGSGWIDMKDVFDADSVLVWPTYIKLRLSDSLEADPVNDKVKIKCRS